MSLTDYLRAGQIASLARENARKKNHVGRTLSEICDSIEQEIIVNGGNPAFPVNVCLNEITAHYTAEPHDQTIVKDTDLLKIDIGVHINGYIADTAVTVTYDSKYDELVNTAELSLLKAIKAIKNNSKSGEIGEIIENTITSFGLKPIKNLSGHSIEKYTIHAGKSIPNIKTYGSSFFLTPNQAYAIEPFVTTKEGLGVVYDGKIKNIFYLASRKPTKDKDCDELMIYLWNKFKTLPFAIRWLLDKYEEPNIRQMMNYLIKKKNVKAYPVLVEGNNKVVAQAEHTVFILDHHTNVITR